MGPARARSCISSSVSTVRKAAGSMRTATPSMNWTWWTFATRSASCRRTRSSSLRPWPRTSRTAVARPPLTGSAPPPSAPWRTTSSPDSPRATLLRGPRAREAWGQWKAGADLDHLDAGSYRLLPQLYQNLHRHGVDEPVLALFRGVYLRTWYENQLRLHQIAGLLRSFRDARIDTIVLKGAALTVLYYKDNGLRPMHDIDLLVHEGAVEK